MASSVGSRKTREEYLKEKELLEARKAGTAPAEVDEDGKEINPHIPQYIAQAPWYLNNTKPSLKHQKSTLDKSFESGWYQRGAFKAEVATKFRKGACTNCGAITHKAKECTEKPRKIGAKYSNRDIRPDEIVQNFELDFDGKRDRWNGYDPTEHHKVIEKFEKADVERRKLKALQLHQDLKTKQENGEPKIETKEVDGELSSDEDVKEKEDQALAMGNKDPKSRTTIRNLRIREDTAKYLRNLDVNSAYYDPKTRSMRANPNPDADPEMLDYAGDNFVRLTGDVKKFAEMQLFAWETADRGQEIHSLANPSQAELLHRQYQEKKQQLKNQQKNLVSQKYGGTEYFDSIPKELLYAQTENYVEFSRDGKIIKGEEKAIPKSKYDEDVYNSNHVSVWGSYWNNGRWGYSCCKQMVKGAYCTRDTTQDVNNTEASAASNSENNDSKIDRAALDKEIEAARLREFESRMLHEAKKKHQETKAKEEASVSSSDSESEDTSAKKSKKRKTFGDNMEVTEEEMEEYNKKRLKFDDPMRNFLEQQE